jgi:hypothetical protein
MTVGIDKALVGTAKNVSPFELHNVTILASVHKTMGTQIDSVKSQLFPVIRISQTVPLSDVPDPAIRQNIAYFSCAEIDVSYNSTSDTLVTGNGKLYTQASVKMDRKTVTVNFLVPPADHQVRIRGIKNTG